MLGRDSVTADVELTNPCEYAAMATRPPLRKLGQSYALRARLCKFGLGSTGGRVEATAGLEWAA
jgi:hypothetical protein